MRFAEQIRGLDWSALSLQINSKTDADVRRALAKPKRDLEDFKALISPAAERHVEAMAQLSQRLTLQRFGKTMQLYVPLYLSNLCSNVCSYCGFSMEHKIRRTTLTMEQLDAELDALKSLGFEHILLVTGESDRKVGMEYFREALPRVKAKFSHISMEVQPMSQQDYAELIEMGLDALLVYQETYNRRRYAEVHLKGSKSDFDYRLSTPERVGAAGVRKIGIGALIGLDDWRVDCWHVAAHLSYLEKHYWQSKFSISFPRLRPCEGSFQPKTVMTDKQLVQLICAYRLLNPDVELSLSTRESAAFRDAVYPLGVTSMSAYSRTQPGGYSDATEQALEQFSISDERHPQAIAKALQVGGYQPVWKDWDNCFLG
ncbi:2-iminoacetate synthase ThiH [Paraferrimonas sedimenticola]|uniref:Thiamine biosynthesis protein ThiH n=1 Tax=Paraferrimonas sedimenticola TaxID=375674 RepID=A0AA37RVY6_9GAMM|nr:2-iminoacetate synthase ThiH [Paraferrimonas sedimenticola]GLP95692.1 thiamine biosynthesis protein ThiH [Paraferrimonas sedimenticola]